MDNDSTGLNNVGKKLVKIIDKRFDRKIKKVNIPYFKDGIITSISNDELTANVKVDDNIRTVTIAKGSELSVGDIVKILYDGATAKNGVVITKTGTNSFLPTKTSFVCSPATGSGFSFNGQQNYILFDEARINLCVDAPSLSRGTLAIMGTIPFTPIMETPLLFLGYSASKGWNERGMCLVSPNGNIYVSTDNTGVTAYRISGLVGVRQ